MAKERPEEPMKEEKRRRLDLLHDRCHTVQGYKGGGAQFVASQPQQNQALSMGAALANCRASPSAAPQASAHEDNAAGPEKFEQFSGIVQHGAQSCLPPKSAKGAATASVKGSVLESVLPDALVAPAPPSSLSPPPSIAPSVKEKMERLDEQSPCFTTRDMIEHLRLALASPQAGAPRQPGEVSLLESDATLPLVLLPLVPPCADLND